MGIQLWQTGGGGGVSDQDLIDIAGISGVRGDIIVRGTSAWERLATGASGTVLIGGTDPAWSATPTLTSLTLSGSTAELAINASTTLDAGTGNEIAYRLAYTTNKATSGNDTGLLISMTDTASPGTSKPLSIQTGAAGATEIAYVLADGTLIAGVERVALGVYGMYTNSSGYFGFTSGAIGSSIDTSFYRDAADTMAMRRTTNAQTFRTYGTYTDASNYVRASLTSNGTSSVTLAAETAGTGADNVEVVISPAGTAQVKIVTGASADAQWVQSTLSSGYSTSGFYNTAGAWQGSVGYANSGAGLFPDSFVVLGNSKPIKLSANGGTTAHLTISSAGLFTIWDGGDVVLGSTTGTKIGTSTSQKLGFWNATPVVQQVLATGAGATVDNIISLLQTLGLCRQS